MWCDLLEPKGEKVCLDHKSILISRVDKLLIAYPNAQLTLLKINN